MRKQDTVTPRLFTWHIMNRSSCTQIRSSHWMCSIKKGIRRNFTKFTGKHMCQSLFFNKLAGLSPATLLKERKRDSGTGVFLWILWNFYEHLFHRTPLDDCFWQIFCKLGVLKFLQNLQENTFIKKRLQQRFFLWILRNVRSSHRRCSVK